MEAHYDDPDFSYVKYWQGRDYEHQSELIALKRLLGSKRFASSADIGGGYGRLAAWLSQRCQVVYLIEPSQKQLNIAKDELKAYPNVRLLRATSDQTTLPDHSLDLITFIRVSHHLPDLQPTLAEFSRLLTSNGWLIFEVANSINFKSRLLNWFQGTRVQLTPIERRSLANIRRKTIPFVNHHPKYVRDQLTKHGFTCHRELSVSNFRSPFLKRHLPLSLLLVLENICQPVFSKLRFGPSIFILASRASSVT